MITTLGRQVGFRRVVLALALVLAGGAAVAAPASAAPTWTTAVVPAAGPDLPHAKLLGIACAGGRCLAVGRRVATDGLLRPFAETRGSTWRPVTAAVPAGFTSFDSVSCSSATFCMIIASDDAGIGQPVRWDGSRFTRLTVGPAGHTRLSDVACRTRADCQLVGTASGANAAWHWNGKVWGRHTAPSGMRIDAVTCPSATACYGVGATPGYTSRRPRAERWNGRSWSAVHLPRGRSGSTLVDISCPTASRCLAVGGGATTAVLSGGRWRLGTMPTSVRRSGDGVAVACTASFTCTSIISYLDAHDAVGYSLVRRTAAGSYGKASRELVDAEGLRCSATRCDVVGSDLLFDRGGIQLGDETVHARAWSTSTAAGTPSPQPVTVRQPVGRLANLMQSVSCAPDGFCAATQQSSDLTRGDTALRTRTAPGGAWSTHATGNITPAWADVDCLSRTFCAAVRRGGSAMWDGVRWTTHAIPQPAGKGKDDVLGVSCTSPTSCEAVGTTGADGLPVRSLVAHWNGSSWTVARGASAATDPTQLNQVSCASATYCLAVGVAYGGRPHPVAERFDGSAWHAVSTSGLPSDSALGDVSCAAASACMVTAPNDYGTPTVSSWDGTRFTPRALPGRLADVYGVSCDATASCTVVGTYAPGGTTFRPLVAHWNGAALTVVPQPVLTGIDSEYDSVSCPVGSSHCTAAGTVSRAMAVGIVGDGPIG
ncbi:hypothetical protein [Jatrophihabitans fulvus]